MSGAASTGYATDGQALDWSAHDNCAHIPNAETIAAMEETEEIIRQIRAGEYAGLTYSSFAELLAELDAELHEEARGV